jgi:hypothetical protein
MTGKNYTNVQADMPNEDYLATATECLSNAAGTAYTLWTNWSKPDCWCYRKQCNGDINGAKFLGKPVTVADNDIMKAAFGLSDAALALVTNGICADLNHAKFLGKHVTVADNDVLKSYFGVADASVPQCPDTYINKWMN